MATRNKEARWSFRVAPEEDALVREAASMRSEDLTHFVRGAALVEADRVLSERRNFVLDAERWDSFVELLDRPVSANPGLEELFSRRSVFRDSDS
jgi:uncharacterized protein (DUF1778 family)